MRTTRRSAQPTLELLSDEEVTLHIIAAYGAINDSLSAASEHSPLYSHNGQSRYLIVLSTNPVHAARGNGTIHDLKTGASHDVRVCFGSSVSDVQLRREFFEDGDGSEVFVKKTSLQCLFRNFLTYLVELQKPREAGRWTFGASQPVPGMLLSAAS